MKKFKPFLLVILLASAVFLSGCFDDREIDETAYIIALGIDKSPDRGFTYTFQFPMPSDASGGGEESSKKGSESGNSSVKNIVVSAPDFYVAKNMTNNFLNKNIDMSHIKMIVFSKDADPDMLMNHSDFLLREREIRPHTLVALASDTAKDYICGINPQLEANTVKYYELLAIGSNNIYAPSKTLSDFVDELSSRASASVLPLAVSAENNSKNAKSTQQNTYFIGAESTSAENSNSNLYGMAVFNNTGLIGTMDGNSALLYNILNHKIKSCTITLKNPYSESEHLSFLISIQSPASYSVNVTGNSCQIDVSQALSVEFLGGRIPDGFHSFDELYSFSERILKEKFLSFLQDISHTKKTDILNIAKHFKKQVLTQQSLESKNWQTLYKNAKFNVNIYFV